MKNTVKLLIVSLALVSLTACPPPKEDNTMLLGLLYLASQPAAALPPTSVSVSTESQDEVSSTTSASVTATSSATTTAMNSVTPTALNAGRLELDKQIKSMSISSNSPIQALAATSSTYNFDEDVNIPATSMSCSSGTGSISGSMHFKVTGTMSGSDYGVSPYVIGTHYTATLTNMVIAAVFTDCVMQVYDLSNPALLTGNPVDWPRTYVKINGSMAMTGSGSQGYDYDMTYTSISASAISNVMNGRGTGNQKTTIISSNLQTVNAATSADAVNATLPTAVSYNSTVEVSNTGNINNFGYTSESTGSGSYTYKNYTGSASITQYWKASGTVGSESFSMFLNMSYSRTAKQFCEELKDNNTNSGYTYDCN
jgi:hypothetical protein